MKKSAVLIITVVLLLFFVSCKDYGGKFEGAWKNINDAKEIVKISTSGKDFIVEYKGVKAPATYDEASDKLLGNNAGDIYELIIDQKSKHLLFLNKEYEKE
jgi:hypothetical protein